MVPMATLIIATALVLAPERGASSECRRVHEHLIEENVRKARTREFKDAGAPLNRFGPTETVGRPEYAAGFARKRDVAPGRPSSNPPGDWFSGQVTPPRRIRQETIREVPAWKIGRPPDFVTLSRCGPAEPETPQTSRHDGPIAACRGGGHLRTT